MNSYVPIIDKQVFNLLQGIKNSISIPASISGFSNNDLIAFIIDQIKDTGDRLNTPIFRIENKFFIYHLDEPLLIPNKNFEEFLKWCSREIGMEEDVLLHVTFRNQLFGRAWRVLKPEEWRGGIIFPK